MWRIANMIVSSWLFCSVTGGSQALASTPDQGTPVPRLVAQTGHGDVVTSVAFSPDGKTVVSGSRDKTLKLWDVATGRVLRSAVAGKHSSKITAVFSPDGKTVLSASGENMLKLWDVTTGQELKTFHDEAVFMTSVLSIAFSPDGKTVVSGCEDASIRLWDVVSGRMLRAFAGHSGQVTSVVFSPEGKTVLSGSADGTLKLWDVATGREMRTFAGHSGWVSSVAFSPDGKTVVSGSEGEDGGAVKLWDVTSGRVLHTLAELSSRVGSVAFSRDGKRVAAASLATIQLWDVATGMKQQSALENPYAGITSIAFGPDDKTMLAGNTNNELTLWDIEKNRNGVKVAVDTAIDSGGTSSDSKRRVFTGQSEFLTSVAFSPDGKFLMTGSLEQKNAIKLWNLESGQELSRFPEQERLVSSVVFSPDGKTAASGSWGKTIKIFDVSTGHELRTLAGHAGWVNSIAYSPDGKTMVSGSEDKTLKLWNPENGLLLRTLTGHQRGISSVVFSPDGQTVVSSGGDDTIRVWNVATGNELHAWSKHKRQTIDIDPRIAVSPDGRTAVSSADYFHLKLWDVASGKELRTFDGHASMVTSVVFSPDGKTVVSGSNDNTLIRWDVVTGKQLRTFTGHQGAVSSVAFSPDGKILASTSSDNTAKLWDARSGRLLVTLVSFHDGRWVTIDPEGRFDTDGLDEVPHLHWVMPDDPLTPVPVEAFMKDYYEPLLLPRILNGEKLKPVLPMMGLNRVQPDVSIVSVIPDEKDSALVNVEVQVSGTRKSYLRNGKKVSVATSAHDLHLFRDGQLAGYVNGTVVKHGAKPYRKSFKVRLATAMSGKESIFSAYAFNDDRVKSATVRQMYQVPATLVPRKGTAYLINMGVNLHDNPAWNLAFAANDARLMRKILGDRLQSTGAYQQIISLSLISDEQTHTADKALLRAVLDRLAGRPPSPLLQKLPEWNQLRPATPDDLLIFTFAGHGYAEDGNFYLITQDTGKTKGRVVDREMLKRSISSNELSQWLKDVDAGDMTLIVDACHSAASVEGKDFKPGPMGSRGLGQLSFDKGMRVLAASQADEYALEDGRLKQGLLSFALITNGIEAFEADKMPRDNKIMLDEWLRYGVERVPVLAEEVKAGNVKTAGRNNARRITKSGSATKKPRPAQQPVLFDFAKKRGQVEVARQ